MLTTFSRIWLINVSLAALVVLFSIMGFNVWLKADETAPGVEAEKAPDKPLPMKGVMERTVHPEATYGAVAEKNLFSPARSEFASDKQQPGQVMVSEKMIFLYGVVSAGDLKQALVNNPDPAPQGGKARDKWVKVGDKMGHLTVSDIRKDRILLTDGARTHEVLLYSKNKPARQKTAAAATTPTVAAAPTVITAAPVQAPAPAPAPAPASAPVQIPAAKPSPEPTVARPDAGTGAATGEYVIVNTPFGPVKRKVK